MARDLQKLPPVLFDHVDVTRLLKDIVKLQHDVKEIKENYGVTTEQLKTVTLELDLLKNASLVNNYEGSVNMRKRGANAFMDGYGHDSGPMGILSLCHENEESDIDGTTPISSVEPVYRDMKACFVSEQSSSKLKPRTAETTSCHTKSKQNKVKKPVAKSQEVGPALNTYARTAEPAITRTPESAITSGQRGHTAVKNAEPHVIEDKDTMSSSFKKSTGNNMETSSTQNKKSFSTVVQQGIWQPKAESTEWVEVQRRRLRNRFSAKTGKAILDSQDKFKAAEYLIPIYVYRVAKGVSVCDISKYIENKAGTSVTIEKMTMKEEKSYDAFKIYVPKQRLDTFMRDDFWPDGVAYRYFVNFKQRKSSERNNIVS